MKKIEFLSILVVMLFVGSCHSGKSQGSTGSSEEDKHAVNVQSGDLLSYKNLTILLIRGKDQINREYLSLEEAMEQKKIILHETGSVGELSADNKSDKHIFIMSGDIVKGGKQDRTIAEDIILKPGCKNVPLKSFCVERSRWSQRGSESTAQFSSSKKILSNKNLKIAAREKKEQQAVWAEVADFQDKAGKNVGSDIKSNQSATSLQLTLENKDLESAVKEYIKATEPLFADKTDILGFAFCVNGKISTVDIFGNAVLFAKLKAKLVESAANEAVFNYNEKTTFENPTAVEIQSFIDSAKKGEETERKTGENTTERKYTTEKSIMYRTYNTDAGDNPIHTTIYNTEDVDLSVNKALPNQQIYRHGGLNRNR